MSSSYVPLAPATVALDAEGRLCPAYGDVYHSPAGALGQAEHVFLRGNGLPERWRGRDAFTVCETGFGLGLNFLALWRAWRDDRRAARTCWRSKAIPSLRRIWPRCWRATRPAAGRPGARAGGSMAAAAAWLASARIRRRGRHADLGLWRGANGGAAFGRLRGCVFPGWFCAGRNPHVGTGAAARTGRHGSAGRDPGHLGLHRRAASGIVRIRFRRAP